MTTIQYINLSLQISGCVISGVVMLCLFLSKRPHGTSDYLYLRMLLLNTGTMLFDATALLCRGKAGSLCFIGVRAANFFAYTCNYLLLAAFLHYLTHYLADKGEVSRQPLKLTEWMCTVSVVLLIVNLFYPIFYEIDTQNIYHRAPLFWVSQMPGIIGMIFGGNLIFNHRHKHESQERAALWAYIFLPLLALLVQVFTYGVAALNLASTVGLVVIFLFIQAEQGRRIAEKENDLVQSRIAIMLSQIQPHFLYNCLNSIGYLCEKDPPAAKTAVDDLADYLRGNLDSLKRTKPVPFEKELEHVRSYLSLEKMRFDEELNLVWEIRSTDFLIPALTVQPLVENAVKHGVGKKVGGGTVTISATAYPDRFEVVVCDDGVGYDSARIQADGRTHIGIDNVRARLVSMVGGTLEIGSELGKGTTATITIKKEDTHHANHSS